MSDRPAAVLLIEDNPGDVRLIREMLAEGEGDRFKVVCAKQLSSGLVRLAANDIDVVLLDLGLPDSQGADTFTKTYSQSPGVPIIVLSGLADEQLAIKTVQEGAQDYLVKGHVDSHTLVRTIRYAIERKRMEELLRESDTQVRKLFEAIPDSILVHDDEGTILHINEIGAEQLEWSAKDLVGRNLCDIVPPESRASIADHIRETHEVGWCRFETTYVARSGWQIMVEVNERPIKFGKEKAILRVARDITERKEAERALLREKNFSAAVMNSSPGLLFVFNDKGNIIQWNRNAEKVTGYSAKEISKMSVLDFVAKEDQKPAAEAMQEVFAKGQSSVEINVLSKPGKKTPFHIMGLRTKFENTTCAVCTGIDITERKQAEEELKESEEKYRTILENIEDGYYEVDLNGNFTFFNASMCRILGYPQEEMMGMNNRQFTDKDNAKKLFKTFNEVYRTGEPTKEFDWQIIRKDGTKRYIEVSISLRRDSSGNPIGFRGVARDITDRKQAEETLRLSEEKYRMVVENAKEAIIITQDVKLVFVNRAGEDMIGYSREILTSKPFTDFIHPDDRTMVADHHIRRIKGEEVPPVYSFRVISQEGTVKWVELNAAVIQWKERPATLNFLNDITDRKQAEEALKKSAQLLRDTGEMAIVGGWELDLLTKEVSWTEEVCRIHGVEPGYKPMLEDALNFYAPESRPDVEAVVKKAAETGQPYDLESLFIPSGSKDKIWVRSLGKAVYSGGKIVKLAGTFQNIDKYKKAEEELQRSYHKLRESLIATVKTLASTVEMKDPYTAGHQRRVTMLACAIAEEMGLAKEQFDGLRMAGLIHDIGKINVPAEILNKSGRISDTEFNIIKIHPQAGYDLLKEIEFPWPVARIVLQHHERLDGSGYPQGLKDGEIMLEAKILAVADVVEAMASHRPYRPASSIEAALHEITMNKGILYDPDVTDACARLFAEKGFALGQEI